MQDAVIVAGVKTAVGQFGKSLKNVEVPEVVSGMGITVIYENMTL